MSNAFVRTLARSFLAFLLIAVAGSTARGAGDAAPPRSRDKRFAFADSLPGETVPAGRARLVLVREQMVRKDPLPPERLYVDGAPLALLPQASYVIADVAPGWHVLDGVLDAPPVALELRAGERALFRLREVIDAQDLIHRHWLLDDPAGTSTLIAEKELPLAITNAHGLKDLAGRRRVVRDAAADTASAPADTAEVLGFDNVWFEHPLDPLNLRRDFTLYTGRLEIGPDGIDYYMEKKRRDVRVEIRYADVVGLRFGGTRSAGVNPWIDLDYRTGTETLRASFADAGDQAPEATYNRMYSAIYARWQRQRSPDSTAAARDGH